jgi:hypothetical protein
MDVVAIAGVSMAALQAPVVSNGVSPGRAFDFDKDEMNRLLAELPSEPDETLR